MSTLVVTGSAGGMGQSICRAARERGDTVIGVDVHDADVTADLSTAAGRADMVEAVTERSGGSIDGLVAAAGVQNAPAPLVLAINYFGAIATLEGLRPLLANGHNASAVAVASNSATCQPGYDTSVLDRLISGDEDGAKQAIGEDALSAYPVSKLALSRWSRRAAVTDEWIGQGIRLNVIAPGFIETPMTENMWEMVSGLGDLYPIPVGRAGTTAEITALVDFLLSPASSFMVGSFLTIDGGTEAALRANEWPTPLA